MSDNDTKFNSSPIKDFAKRKSIKCKYTSTYNPRVNAKVERLVGTRKRSMKKVILPTGKQWDQSTDKILRGCRLRPGADGVSPFEAMFGVRASSSHDPPEVEYVASEVTLIRQFEFAAMKPARSSRAVPMSSPPEANFKVRDLVLMRS